MQTKHLSHAAIAFVISMLTSVDTFADDCATSFYCYNSSAAATVNTASNPPPLPAPPRRAPSLRPMLPTLPMLPWLSLPTAQPVSPMAQPAPPVASPVFRGNPPPPPVNIEQCLNAYHNLLDRAANLENRAITAARNGQRQQANAMFYDVGRMRADAQRMVCR